MRTLIVEDNRTSSKLLQAVLDAEGYETCVAFDGQAALEILKTTKIDCIVSDVTMPIVDGYRLLYEIKENEHYKNIPFIFYTATFTSQEDEQFAMILGASKYIHKPNGIKEIVSSIKDLLSDTYDTSTKTSLPKESWVMKKYSELLFKQLEKQVNELEITKASLQKSEMRLMEAQEMAQMGNWEIDLNTNKHLWSDQMYKVFGIKNGEEPSLEMYMSLIHPEEKEHLAHSVEKAFSTRQASSCHFRFIPTEGIVRHGYSEWKFELDEDKKTFRMFGIVQDITEKKEAEEQRKNSDDMAIESVEIKKLLGEVNLYSKKLENSINYAKRLQDGIHLKEDVFKQVFQNAFIINNPKEIVSGDFYWLNIKQNKIMLALGDCTGHGVPGAILSTLGYNMINNIALNNDITSPDLVLKKLYFDWKKTFNHNSIQTNNDGMEISMCTIDYAQNILEFSGMGGSLLIVRNNELTEYRGEKIGIYQSYSNKYNNNNIEKLSSYKIPFEVNDCIYLFSDGYADQFGGPGNNEKFTKKRFKDLILSIQEYPIEIQKKCIKDAFSDWKGNNEQIDDVLVIAVQL